MSRDLVYPEVRAGPFPEPPVSFTDGEGREITVRESPPGSPVPEALVEMYAAFDPSDRAQGIPPTEADAARRWLETIYADGYNVVAWHGDDAAGHATLVPADGGKATNAGDRPRQTEVGDSDTCNSATPTDRGPYELAIFVLQSYQRAGIGTRLLEGLLGHAQAEGIERVWLSVERWNTPAIELYRDFGFEMADTANFELVMSLRL